MNIYDGIKKLPFKKQYYIKYKFNLWFDQEKTMTEEELQKLLQMKSLNSLNAGKRQMNIKPFNHLY